MSHSH